MATLSQTAGSTNSPQDFVPTLLLNAESGAEAIMLPEGFHLPSAEFARAGGDLQITVGDGTTILVQGFFDGQTPPNLTLPEGAQLPGELVAKLAGPQAPGQFAQSELGLSAQPIGSVESVSGSVIAVRADGTRVELDVGDPVFQGDILETAEDGVIGIVLADETTFSMAENGRMVLDEMVYDPGAQEGSISFSVVQGVFTFVSGQVAKTDPDAMTLTTPVATIGIRGTQVGIAIPDGIKLSVVLMLESDGFIGEVIIRNAGGIEVMNLASQLIEVAGFGVAPFPMGFVTEEELVNTFGSSLRHLPLETGAGNDYGVQQGGPTETEEEEEVEEGLEDEEVEDLEEELVAEEVEESLVEEIVDLQTAGAPEGDGVFTEPFTKVTNGFGPGRLGLINPFTTPNGGAGTQGTEGTTGTGGENSDNDFNELDEFPLEESQENGGGSGTSGVPDVSVSPASGDEDTEIGLTISASVSDGTDSVDFVTISGIPDGASLSAGSDAGVPGSWNVSAAQLSGLTITPPSDFNGAFSLTVTATTTTGTESTAQVMDVSVAPVADIPDVSVSPASGDEDTAIALSISASVPDSTETVDFITVNGVPDGASLSAGTDNGGGVWTLEPGDLAGLTLTPADDFNGDFDLTVTATSTDGGESAAQTLPVSVGDVSDTPEVSVSPASGDEDTAIALSISASVPDSTETVDFITISGVPDGATLSAGTDTGGGVWTLEPEGLAALTIAPADDFNGDFDLSVTATSTDGSTSDAHVLAVTVAPVSDVPEVSASPASGDEDTAIALSISASVPDSTETVDFITISGLPDGATLSAGTDNGGGVWTLEPEDLAGLALTPADDFNGDFDLSVTATSTDGGESAPTALAVSVSPVADVPMVTVSSASGDEDTAIALSISASVPDSTETVDFITISGVPDGASLSAGTDGGGGIWTLEPGDLAGLTITPADDFNGAFDLSVTATSTDGGTSEERALSVSVGDLSDVPQVSVSSASGDEDTSIALSISASVPDSTETVDFITISGVPDGASLSAGTDNGGGIWTLETGDLAGLTLTPADDFNGAFDLSVTATSTDGGESAPTALTVSVTPVADIPEVSVSPASGDEDSSIALSISASVPDSTETVDFITISGVPDGASLSAGTDTGGGVWTLEPGELTGLTLTPPDDFNGAFALTVTATSTDGGTSAGQSLSVSVGEVSDTPEVSVLPASGDEDSSIALSISVLVPDSTETVDFITISGVPDGASLSAGTNGGGGVWTLGPGDLAGLTLTPPSDFNGDFDLSVTATSTDGSESGAQTLAVTVGPLADVPEVLVSPASGDEDSSIALSISASVPDSTETVDFITISGVPDGATLSAGTDTGGGVWTLEPGDLAGLTLTPPGDFNGDFDLSVTATSTDGSESGAQTLAVTVGPLADIPEVSVSPASGDEDSSIALSISASVPDSTETVDFITISGVPDGATLSAGTDTGGGVWTLEPEDLDGLTLTPADDFNGDFDLTVTATSTDGGESDEQTLSVSVGEAPDAPEVSVSPASGDEDSSIALSISASVPDSTETVDFITISGVPDGASLSAGTDSGGGVWTLEPEDLDGLTLTPADDFNGDFDLSVTATSTDGGTSGAQTLAVSVAPVPEDANVAFRVSQNTTGAPDYDIDSSDGLDLPPPDDYGVAQTAEFQGKTVEYTYDDADTASVSLLDGWNSIKNIEATSGDAADIILSNFVHTDVTLGDGGDSSVVIDGAKRGNISTGDGNDFIDVDARSNGNGWSNVFDIDSGAGNDRIELDGDRNATEFVVDAGAGADEIVLEGDYDNSELTGGLGDDLIDGGEGFDVAIFSGTCDQYEITLDEDSGDITVSGPDGTDTVRDVEVLRFDDKDLAVEDLFAVPLVSVEAASGNEDTAIALTIAVTQTNPTDPIAAIVIGDLPAGATLAIGSDSGLTLDGARITGSGPSGRLTADDLSDLSNGKVTVTPPANSDEEFSLSVTAETEGGRTSEPASLPVTVNAVADPPVITAVLGEPVLPAAAQLAAIAPVLASLDDGVVYPLQITVELTDVDGSETLSDITVSGLPEGATLSAGTDTGNGVYTLTLAQLNKLTLRVGEEVADDFSIEVSVSSVETEGGDTATASVTVDVPVNDAPVLFGDGEAAVGAGQAVTLSDDDLRLEDEESGSDELIYELTDDVDLGVLYLGDGAGGRTDLEVGDTFTQEDVDLGLLVYEQDGDLVHFWDPETPDWPEASEVIQSNLTMPLEAEGVTVTFEGERAAFHNTLGWYRFDEDGNPTDPQIVWVDASDGVLPRGSTASLEGLSPGEEFGLFIIQDGARRFPWLDGQVNSNNTLRFDDDGNLEFVNDGGQVVQEIGSNRIFYSGDAELNPDGVNHALAGLEDGELRVGFEDLTGGGDKDFDDLLFTLRYDGVLGPRESVSDGFTVTARDGDGAQVADNDDPSQGYTVAEGEADFDITIDNMT